jgi:O-antigen/teichoic acid export membrane protein
MSGYITILGGQWITYAVAILSTAYITRALGPEDYVKFVQMQFIVSIFTTVFSLSIPSAVSRYAAEHIAKGEVQRASGVLKTALNITAITGTIASIIMFLSSKQLAKVIMGNSEATVLIELLAISVGPAVAASPLYSYVYARQKFGVLTLMSVLGFTLWRFSLVVALYLGTGLYGLSIAWMAVSIVLSLVIAIPILRMAGRAEIYPFSKLFSYSMPLFVSSCIGFLSQWADSIILPYFGSMNMLCMTNIAMTLVNVSLVLLNSASTVIFTHFVRIDAIDGREALFETGKRISKLLSFCFVPLGFFFGAISDLLVFLYAGSAFAQASFFIKILSPFMTIGAVFSIIWTNEVTVAGKTKLFLLNTIASLVSYFLLGILLVPWLGETGYILSRILCSILAYPYIWIKTKALIPIRFDFRALLISAFFSIVIIIPASLVQNSTSSYLLSSVTSILGLVCYALIITKTGLLKKDEIRLILRLVFNNIRFYKSSIKQSNQSFVQSINSSNRSEKTVV